MAFEKPTIDTVKGKMLICKQSILNFSVGDLCLCTDSNAAMRTITLMHKTSTKIYGQFILVSFDVVAFKPGEKPLAGKKFAITGKLDYVRDYYKMMIKISGGTYASSVSRSTTYLITDESNETTKMRAAIANGTTIINSAKFLRMVNGK